MTTPHAAESETTPPTVIPAVIAYAPPSVVTARGSVPPGRAIFLTGAFFLGQLPAALIAAGVHVYLYIAPELPGSRVRDAFSLMLPDAAVALLASGILFVTLRMRQFPSTQAIRRLRPVAVAAAVAGLAQVAVVTAVWQALTVKH